MKFFVAAAAVAAILSSVNAQSPIYGQCGGTGWTGPTTCASGSVCTYSNAYYSQCLPGSAGGSTSTPPTTTTNVPTSTSTGTTSSGTSCANRTKFKFFGVSESCAEFAGTVWPGQLGKDYTWPSPSSIDYFMGQGFNTFRIPFLMERMSPPSTGLTGPFNATYLSGLQTIVTYITGKGGFALIDPHNYMRYNNAVITSTSQFQTWWQNLASLFKNNNNVMFDVMNEPYDIDATTVASLNQAAINGIRASGATSQMIMVEGTSWTGAWTWTTSGNSQAFVGLKDPNNNMAIEMHQYLDSDGSGTSATCVSSTIGAERLANATAWLKANNLKGFLGEIGAGSDPTCIAAVQGALCEMQQAGGAWLGASWWAAGPWWSNYFMSIEPPSGGAIPSILPQALLPFL